MKDCENIMGKEFSKIQKKFKESERLLQNKIKMASVQKENDLKSS